MLDGPSDAERRPGGNGRGGSGHVGPLITLAYRSEPTNLLSEPELVRLVGHARRNNRTSSISGLLVSRPGELVQLLEGPEDSIDRLMQSIACDPRHRNLDILERRSIEKRLFGAWTMLLAADRYLDGVPQEATVLLPRCPGKLVPGTGRSRWSQHLQEMAEGSAAAKGVNGHRFAARTARTEVAELLLLPPVASAIENRLTARLRTRNMEDWAPAARALTTLLLGGESGAVEHFVRTLSMRNAHPLALQVTLFEQVERKLGDLWRDDRCSEADIVLALMEMSKTLRILNSHVHPVRRAAEPAPLVLVVPQPGERHLLPAVLDAEVLWQRGWDPALDFPGKTVDLESMLAAAWYDAVDISLSGVFRRRERLQQVSDTVSRARKASLNPKLAVTIGGRAAYEDRSLWMVVGADGIVRTASDVDASIETALKGPA